MRGHRCIRGLATLGMALAISLPALAGRTCEVTRATPASMEAGLRLAQRTHEALEAAHAKDGTQVVLLARAGQDLSKYGLRYSHLGIAYRTQMPQGQPAWRVLHKLNDCGAAVAAIYRQGLGEFFLDDLWRYEAAWVVPTPDVQGRLAALLQDDARAVRLHHRPYSIVSYAWGTRYQQSNQWAAETLAAAMEPGIANREAAQAWLRFKGYEPTTLRLGPLTRLGGRATAANVAFDDHPNEQRFSDRIQTVTVDSMFAWMQRAGLGGTPVVLR
ncbi:MAG: DUF2145 domain-containing protein [Comamonadaceae bacterium]|nr:MAG: DUF2145 domain-containing protein [Comamonadaceae bacterium]